MGSSITVRVLDKTTGERLHSPDVRLYRRGVPGETFAEPNGDGSFSFAGLDEGEYSLGIYDANYPSLYENVTLAHGDSKVLELGLTPGGFLTGQILDEEGHPPQRCHFTLLKAGERRGKSGYINDSGDRVVAEDGQFRSPALYPAKYFLRIAGILRKPTVTDPSKPSPSVIERCFDFVYPNAYHLSGATGFDITSGEESGPLQVRIPRPVRYTVRGRIIGNLPEKHERISVMFARDIGAIEPVGGTGGHALHEDGTFEDTVLPGRYIVEVCEFAQPEPNGRTHGLRKFGNITIDVTDADLDGIEIPISW